MECLKCLHPDYVVDCVLPVSVERHTVPANLPLYIIVKVLTYNIMELLSINTKTFIIEENCHKPGFVTFGLSCQNDTQKL